jgi:CRP-like cAMP-binding protein
MQDVLQAMSHNRILTGLPAREREYFVSSLELASLELGDVLHEQGGHIDYLYFPVEAAISVTDLVDAKHIVEVTVIGKEGCSGSSVVLGSDRSASMAIVQIGGNALRVATAPVMKDQDCLPYLTAALRRYNSLLMEHAVISVGCSQFHTPGQRVARWLKAHWHRTGLETFPFTADFLAVQVGVEAETVAEILEKLQKDGVITRRRHSLTITDQDVLGRLACACFEQVKVATDGYVAALGHIREPD